MPLLANAQMTVASAPGTGSITLSAATPGAQTWSAASAADGAVYGYRVEEGTAWEIGFGVYTASGTKLSRTTVLASSNGNAAVSFGSAAIVSQIVLPTDIVDRQPAVGDLVLSLGNLAPIGCLKLNGASLNRVTYAGLWAWAQANANVVTDSAWTGGATAAFSQGDGSTTFRIPDFRGEMLRMFDDGRGLDNGRGLGTIQGQNQPGHSHVIPMGFQDSTAFFWMDNATGTVPFTGSNTVSANYKNLGGLQGLYNGTFRYALTGGVTNVDGGENRPRNVSPLACIRYK